ncbi:putative NBD/HSP70 family sugar kinase [Frigoribacterium sp. PhB160]|uniref:ROK family transcriptional regulator n=1 Tax=Frigoribacterium sp. PhB160 TaxID=2485192 RepID=UPI000F47EC7A|nr:ROK family transcriptional regulator [Frigoribacterium sp. PhB160]ROS61467.1 putative NBD/HSP70 family sugar kinase [Frigoribacterium sp. PhB160]
MTTDERLGERPAERPADSPVDRPSSPSRELAREVLVHGPISRAELAVRLGLSAASLTRLSRPLLDAGWLVETDDHVGGAVGRPVRPLDVRVGSAWHVGVKLTGERAFGVATDLRAAVLAEATVDLPGHDPSQVVDAVVEVVGRLAAVVGTAPPDALGVTVGGFVARSRVAVRAPFLGWRDVDLGGLLAAATGLPVVVENDVVALVEAEHWFGLGRGLDRFAVVTTGAGVGYGLVVHGRQVRTADTGLGLGAHVPLDPAGPTCPEGHVGCSTALLSTGSVVARVGEALGRVVSYDEVLALAAADEPAARSVVDEAGRALGRLAGLVADLAMVEAVVLGGEGIGLVDVARAAFDDALASGRDPAATPVRVLVGESTFDVWARGAAAVAIQSRVGVVGPGHDGPGVTRPR